MEDVIITVVSEGISTVRWDCKTLGLYPFLWTQLPRLYCAPKIGCREQTQLLGGQYNIIRSKKSSVRQEVCPRTSCLTLHTATFSTRTTATLYSGIFTPPCRMLSQ